MLLDLSAQELLQTTRAVRRRLDFQRPVEAEVLQECLEMALQAPTGSNNQHWHFLLVTDQRQRNALGDLYRRGFVAYCDYARTGQAVAMRQTARPTRAAMEKLQASSQYLLQHIHEAPAMLIPCIEDRVEGESVVEQANAWVSWINTPEGGAAWAKAFAANSTTKGAVELADEKQKKFFTSVYTPEALKNLWWQPGQTSWFVAKRTDFAKKFMS